MTHTYKVTGMTCGNCEAKVKSSLLMVPDITSVEVSKDTSSATITMDKHIPLSALQLAFGGPTGKYQISAQEHNESIEQTKSWFSTYKPLLILFVIISALSLFASIHNGKLHGMMWMQYYMAGFFLSFSYFKLINLTGFAESYSMYDVVAKKLHYWGYIYAFIELALGIAYFTSYNPIIINLITFLVMSVSLIGVLQSVMNKRKIQCACLGAVFNLPMSTVTIVEDVHMIAMSAIMLIIN